MMLEGGVVDLHDYHLSRYDQSSGEDRKEVEKAQEEGRSNLSAMHVLVMNACHHPRQTAERRIKESCPSLTLPPTSMRAPCTPRAVPAVGKFQQTPSMTQEVTTEPMEVTPGASRELKKATASSSRGTSDSDQPPSLEENSAVEGDTA